MKHKSQVVAVHEGSELIDRDRRSERARGEPRTGVVEGFNFDRTKVLVRWNTGKVTTVSLLQPGFSKRFTCK